MRLFNAFSAPGYHTSLVSTFGVDFEAYEAIALPRLRDAGCNNNILVADARMLVQSLGDAARRPKFAGRRYSVVGANCAGVFHPKLVLQLGKTSGRLMVMSANMTAAGLAGNFEVVGEVTVTEDTPESAPLLRTALDYFLLFLDPASAARRQVEWALKRSRWLPPSTDDEAVVQLEGGMRLSFLHSSIATGIGERFIQLVGARAVKRLIVMSPYWDSDLHTLRSLRNRFGAAKVATLIQPQSALYPVHAQPSEGLFELFDVNDVQGANASRFAHAKVFIVESDAGDCMLFGSSNCTRAALGALNEPGLNAEACLFRDLLPGDAVRSLGLEDAISGKGLTLSEVPAFTPTEEIPLRELEAKLPGRFELLGDLLRWWPSTSIPSTDTAVIELLDQQGELLTGTLTRVGTQSSPAAYRLGGTVAPHFAKVSSGTFESSLGVVVVEQAIHESQRRAAGRGVESALELLDDEDAAEGLWLLEVIQRLTEAEREMRGPRGASQAPNQKPSVDTASDSQVLSYEAFVAGRRSQEDATAAAGSHLGASHHESVRGFLNALIGKHAALDLADDLSDDGAAPNLSMGDETKDAAAALESDDLQPVDVAQTMPQDDDTKKQLLRRQRYIQDTQRSIVDGVGAFLKTLRDEATGGRTLGVIDLLRLRALLVVVLGAASKKANLLARDLAVQVPRRQVLPSNGEESWLRLVGRLLYDFFRDHSGTRAPLVKSLALEPDEDLGLPEDVLECWATCFWAVCAIRVAINDSGVPAQTANTDLLAMDLYRFVRLLPEQALGNVVREVFAGMNRRYAERIGASAHAIEREHQRLVAAIPIGSAGLRLVHPMNISA